MQRDDDKNRARLSRWLWAARWSRADSVLLEGLAMLAIVLAVALGVGLPLVAAATGQDVVVQALLGDDAVDVTDVPANQEISELTAAVTVAHPSPQQAWTAAVPQVLDGLLIGTGAWLILRLARTLRAGDPFTPANARRLTLLALVVGIGSTASQMLHIASTLAVLDIAPGGPYVAGGVISFLPLLLMLALAALAEVFRRGARMAQDVEGLV